MSRSTCVVFADDLEPHLLAERAGDVAHHARKRLRRRRRTAACGRPAPRRKGDATRFDGAAVEHLELDAADRARNCWHSSSRPLRVGERASAPARSVAWPASDSRRPSSVLPRRRAAGASAAAANRRTASPSAIRRATRPPGRAGDSGSPPSRAARGPRSPRCVARPASREGSADVTSGRWPSTQAPHASRRKHHRRGHRRPGTGISVPSAVRVRTGPARCLCRRRRCGRASRDTRRPPTSFAGPPFDVGFRRVGDAHQQVGAAQKQVDVRLSAG